MCTPGRAARDGSLGTGLVDSVPAALSREVPLWGSLLPQGPWVGSGAELLPKAQPHLSCSRSLGSCPSPQPCWEVRGNRKYFLLAACSTTRASPCCPERLCSSALVPTLCQWGIPGETFPRELALVGGEALGH